ncbi:MAG: hypothetical protein K6D97_04460 [Clostridia bacterium]|nr:hypothetical protein [Clostridia bacterium]
MSKKVLKIAIILFVMLLAVMSIYIKVYATTSGDEVLVSDQATELLEIKESAKHTLDDYVDKYGSTTFGFAAYVLNAVRIYSIPFCFVGIAIGAVYQYTLGIRKLDLQERGLAMVASFVTILLICQVLPFIFAIVVNGWRG